MKRVLQGAGLGLVMLLAGCQSAPMDGAPAAASKSRSRYVMDFSTLKVVGYLGLASSAADIHALEILAPRLEQAVATQELPYIIMRPDQVAATAARFDVGGLHKEVLDHWRDNKRLTKLDLQELCETLGFDALLVANIEEWSQTEPTVGSTDASATRISVVMEMYSAETGRRGWRERCSKTLEAEQPLSEAANTGRQAHGIARLSGAGTEPPRFEEVADMVVEVVAAKLAKASGF